MRFNEIDTLQQNQLDFVPRERSRDIWNIITAFTTVMVIVAISIYAPIFDNMEVYGPVIALVMVAILCLYVVYRKQINLDLVMSTEYQNLLFAQSLTIGCSFCFIARSDGTIVHASDAITKVFPSFDYARSRSLQGVFEQGVVRTSDRERIMAAIHTNTPEHLIFPIHSNRDEKKDYILTVDPLPRPSGFSIIRGREYLGQRTGMSMLPDLLRSTTMDKIDHLLASTPIALYTTDAFGKFEYVNPAFERALGYDKGEMLESKLSLYHVIFSMGGRAITEDQALADHNGDALLIPKLGGRQPVKIIQHILRDANGKALGSTGSVIAA